MTTELEKAVVSKLADARVEEDLMMLAIMNIVAALAPEGRAAELAEELATGIIRSMMSKAPNDEVKANVPKLSEYIAASMQPVVKVTVEAFSEMTEDQSQFLSQMEN